MVPIVLVNLVLVLILLVLIVLVRLILVLIVLLDQSLYTLNSVVFLQINNKISALYSMAYLIYSIYIFLKNEIKY